MQKYLQDIWNVNTPHKYKQGPDCHWKLETFNVCGKITWDQDCAAIIQGVVAILWLWSLSIWRSDASDSGWNPI